MTPAAHTMRRDPYRSPALFPVPPLVSVWLPAKLLAAGLGMVAVLVLQQATTVPVQVNLVIDAALIIVILGAVWRFSAASAKIEAATVQGATAIGELKAEVKSLRDDTVARNVQLTEIKGTLNAVERGQQQMALQVGGALTITQDLKERATKAELKSENLGVMIGELRHDVETSVMRIELELGKLRDFRHDVESAASGIELAEALRRRKEQKPPAAE